MPTRSARFWSSQLPLATHTAHTWLRSAKRSSTIIRRKFRSRSVLVCTFISSKTCVVQAGIKRGGSPTSTRHIRQAPTSETPSRWQSVGIAIPASFAASRIVWSPRALMSFPSIDRVLTAAMITAFSSQSLGRRAALAQGQPWDAQWGRRRSCVVAKQFLVFIAEVTQRAQHGVGGRLSQAAETGQFHHLTERLEPGQVVGRRLPLGDPGQQPVQLDSPGAAGDTLAARLVHAELHEELGNVDHIGGLVHDNHPARAHDRAQLHEGPPVWTALILPPSGAPPPISSTISLKEVPMGTSTSPVLRILPARAKTFVPLLFSVPIAANQSGPLRMMTGMLAKVSTLLMRVGFPQSPEAAG